MKSLVVQFDQQLRRDEIPRFRGAFVNALPGADVLFHNHIGNGLHYAYPLVQYKTIGGRAAVVCVGDGIDAMGDYFTFGEHDYRIGSHSVRMCVENIDAEDIDDVVSEPPIAYAVRDWLPLNEDNYPVYMSTASLRERIEMLERIMVGNILSLMKGIGIRIDNPVYAVITSMQEPRIARYKGMRLMSFDIEMVSNVVLPDNVGVGKHASVGYGVLTKQKKRHL